MNFNYVDLKIDSSGYLVSVNGNLQYVKGLDYIKQAISQKLRTFKNEYIFNTAYGVPYIEKILNKQVSDLEVSQILSNAILSVKGVNKIIAIFTERDNKTREIKITFSCNTVYGSVTNEVAGVEL